MSAESTLPITVCIPAKDEERNLVECINCLQKSFAKVVVVDSGSTDETPRLAREAGAELIDFQWNGQFPKKRNWFLRHHRPETEWVLFLDADERVTPEFIAELHKTLPTTTHNGFWLPFQNWFMGRQLKHGDPFRKLALFRVSAGEYERFDEDWWSHLDMEVHEHPVLQGTVGELKSPLEHHEFHGLHRYIAKHNEYSTWEARRWEWFQTQGQEAWNELTPRQKTKYQNLDKWWLCWAYFLVSYVLKKGFLDGEAGFVFASMKRRYFSDIRRKIREGKESLAK
ncbi:glycosyltransferase family 2 protein [Roseibacillus persicicus]|uniref:glycosyltransferase family 2 protein n=1 Tax=Roseibacillus persicicus TaxID=454148 RepID=UPI00280E581A|nr:glycosyltransferase family 2 protein [Roseibacillus persicicus]MDQ8190605.1 glycosyltransferase family 2 protein [Roseibacillus persicicus]